MQFGILVKWFKILHDKKRRFAKSRSIIFFDEHASKFSLCKTDSKKKEIARNAVIALQHNYVSLYFPRSIRTGSRKICCQVTRNFYSPYKCYRLLMFIQKSTNDVYCLQQQEFIDLVLYKCTTKYVYNHTRFLAYLSIYCRLQNMSVCVVCSPILFLLPFLLVWIVKERFFR